MPISPDRYNSQEYWQGRKTEFADNAGYSFYRPVWLNCNRGSLPSPECLEVLPEHWRERARQLINKLGAANWKILELGCGPGQMVHRLRQQGQEAYGLDVSQWALDWGIQVFQGLDPDFGHMVEAPADISPFLVCQDATATPWPWAKNYFNCVFSLDFLECLEEAAVPAVVTEIGRVLHPAGWTYHLIRCSPPADFYLTKPIEWWASLNWPKNTILVRYEDGYEVLV